MRTAPLLILLAACSPSAGTGEAFTGGNFDFETTGVQDGCYDGSFEVLFLPEGAGTTNPWGDPIYVPGFDELPSTYEAALPDPFAATEVEVTGDAETRTVTGAQNTDVELDPDSYPGCLVDMNIDVDLVIVDADTVQGTATLHTAGFDEESCPVIDADPCDITLDIQGTRL